MTDPLKEFAELDDAYSRIREILTWPDELLTAPAAGVSEWSAGQHLHHIAQSNRVIARSIAGLVTSESETDADRRVNLAGITILASGYIPRGRGKAPARLHPPSSLAREDIESAVTASVRSIDGLKELAGIIEKRRSRLKHPYLGYLRSSQWLRFMNVHTGHHLRIVRDVEHALRNPAQAT